MQHIHGNIPLIFDCWANPVVQLFLLRAPCPCQSPETLREIDCSLSRWPTLFNCISVVTHHYKRSFGTECGSINWFAPAYNAMAFMKRSVCQLLPMWSLFIQDVNDKTSVLLHTTLNEIPVQFDWCNNESYHHIQLPTYVHRKSFSGIKLTHSASESSRSSSPFWSASWSSSWRVWRVVWS